MVDSRDKGARAEAAVKRELAKYTDHNWQRIPSSGALDEVHGLKGDLYVPNEKNLYCVEVKHYKEDHLNSKLLVNKTSNLRDWWEQAVRQGEQVQKRPLLIYKWDRSKLFVVTSNKPTKVEKYIYISEFDAYVVGFIDWLTKEEIRFI